MPTASFAGASNLRTAAKPPRRFIVLARPSPARLDTGAGRGEGGASGSGTFDFDEADLGRRTLQEDLERQGLLFAALDWRRFDRRRPAAGERVPVSDTVRGAITYFITRGSVTEIRAIQFPGMTALDEDDVRDTLATKVYDFFGTGGYLGVEQMFADLRALRASYHALGYYRMRFQGFSRVDTPVRRVERRDRATLYVWQIEDMGFTALKPDRGNVLHLEVPIEEGTRSVLAGVDVSGTDKGAREDALGALALEVAQPFSQTVLKQALQRLRGLYLDRGHPDASVTVPCATHARPTGTRTRRLPPSWRGEYDPRSEVARCHWSSRA